MAYRKLDVDGVEYQYTIGKTHVKVRGMEAIEKSQIGTETYDEYGYWKSYTVTPEAVRAFIRTQK